MRDERILAANDRTHGTFGPSRQHGGDHFDIQRFGPAAEPTAHIGFDHADLGLRYL